MSFIVGLFIGALLGIVFMCALAMAREDDEF